MKKNSQALPPPPGGLSPEARHHWRRLTRDFDVTDAAGILLLKTALESYDELCAAKALIARDGALIRDRFGQLKAHPATGIARDARTAMLAAFRQLKFDPEIEGHTR